MNLFVGIGNLTRDPEMRYTQDGVAYTKFTIAINSSKKGGEAFFIECTAWEKLAETVAEYQRKGMKVCVTGELREDRWEDNDGTKRNKTYCNARNVEFLDRPRAQERQDMPSREIAHREDELPF